jgi:oxygen-dependent protoporphyrinogen oxidase
VTSVLVVGGGITGLAAARELAAAGLEVSVVESADRWGGKLDSAVVDGVRLDTGAESVLARRPEAVGLIEDLGLGADRVHPTAARPRLLVGGTLHDLPPSVVGVPTDLDSLRSLLSAQGYREATGRASRATPLDHDRPIGEVVDERMGREVTDRLLEPMLGGIYAGHARELSFEAVAHGLFERARQPGRLVDHAQSIARPSTGTPVFAGLAGGITQLVDGLLAELGGRDVELRSGATVRDLARRADGRFALTVRGPGTTTSETVVVDAVVLATPARVTGRLVAAFGQAGGEFAAIPYASVAVLTLVVRGLQTDASGVLVPPGELATIKAVTHSSTKWSWVGEQAEQTWGPDTAVVRVSIGRVGEERLLQLPDADLVRRTWAEAQLLPGWGRTTLLTARVTRWGGALPQYRVGHRDLVARLRGDLAPVRGLAVAGAALDGVGIAACLGSVSAAVAKITADLGAQRGEMGS